MKDSISVTVALVPGVCGDCKQWEPFNDDTPLGTCRFLTNAFQQNPVMGYAENAGAINTRDSFGCNQWEVKE